MQLLMLVLSLLSFSGCIDLVKDVYLMVIVFVELLLFIKKLYLIFQQCSSGSVFIGTYFFIQHLVAE